MPEAQAVFPVADPRAFAATVAHVPGAARDWLASVGAGPDSGGAALTAWVADELFKLFDAQAAVMAFVAAAAPALRPLGDRFAQGDVDHGPGLVVLAGRYLGLSGSPKVYDTHAGVWSRDLVALTGRARWVRVLNLHVLFAEKVADLCTTTPQPPSGPTPRR
jgi:hypothetical protein